MKTPTWRRTLCAALLSAGVASAPVHAADVVIGVPNWPSVAATASILKVVLEDNLGLEVELQNGTNPVIFEAMDSGSMHVHPEVWLPNQTNLHDKFVKSKGTVRMNPNGVAAFQGMCVTKATAERTGITRLADLADPDMAKHFDTNGDGRGEIWIGRFRLGLDQHREDPAPRATGTTRPWSSWRWTRRWRWPTSTLRSRRTPTTCSSATPPTTSSRCTTW